MVSIFVDVTPPSFDPKHGLLRIDEFNLSLSEEERQSSNSTGPPELKKRKQSGPKKATTEEVFKRQHKAAYKILLDLLVNLHYLKLIWYKYIS